MTKTRKEDLLVRACLDLADAHNHRREAYRTNGRLNKAIARCLVRVLKHASEINNEDKQPG